MRGLKAGDPCPCCGQPIKWKNPRILQLLTYAAEGELTRAGLEELLDLTEQEDGMRVCARCSRKRPVACTVDGSPWCEECFDDAMGLIREAAQNG